MSAVAKAKDTLLRALEELEAAEGDLAADADRVDLVVVYSIGKDEGEGGWHEVGGWVSTGAPMRQHAAMLRRAADAQDDAARRDDDPDEPDGDQD